MHVTTNIKFKSVVCPSVIITDDADAHKGLSSHDDKKFTG